MIALLDSHTRRIISWPDLLNHSPLVRYLRKIDAFRLAGLVLSIGGVARGSVRRLLPYVLCIVIPVTLLYTGFYAGVQFVGTGADRLGECPGLDQTAASSNVIPESKSRPG